MSLASRQLLSLGNHITAALAAISTTCKRLFQANHSIKKDVDMWSSHIMDYPAHWLLIAHNSRNNRRTKRKK